LLFTIHCSLFTASAATKVFLHVANAALQPSPEITYRLVNDTQGTGIQTAITNSTGADVTGQYWPSSTTGHIITKTAGGTKTIWISAPLSGAVTIASLITPNFWGLESATQCNCTFRYEVMRWSVAEGGIVSSLGMTADDAGAEWTVSAAAKTAPTLSPSSTAFAVGDRIVIVVYNDDPSGLNQGATRTWTLDYDAGTGVDGDTYLSFTETIAFSSDTNNARPIPLSSRNVAPASSRHLLAAKMAALPRRIPMITRLLRPLLSWWADFWDGALV